MGQLWTVITFIDIMLLLYVAQYNWLYKRFIIVLLLNVSMSNNSDQFLSVKAYNRGIDLTERSY